jgi:osmoprotectant transport system ATP-binding protein
MITFDNVSKVYPDGTVAVDNLTISAPNGKITTLVGRPDVARRPRCG